MVELTLELLTARVRIVTQQLHLRLHELRTERRHVHTPEVPPLYLERLLEHEWRATLGQNAL